MRIRSSNALSVTRCKGEFVRICEGLTGEHVVAYPIHMLSICSGIGGLDLGVKVATGARTICYVEREAFAASVIVARMEDQSLDQAPIWDDLTTFDGRPWRGKVDCIIAGFPCQPVSHAGKRAGQDDQRWIWSDIVRIIREVRPRFIFLENVSGILSLGAGAVLGSLARMGFDAEWGVVSARGVGAPHQAEKVVLPGLHRATNDATTGNRRKLGSTGGTITARSTRTGRDAVMPWTGMAKVFPSPSARDWRGANGPVHQSKDRPHQDQLAEFCDVVFPPGPQDREGWSTFLERFPEAKPAICRDADGASYRMDRLRALGNGVVPLQAAAAFRLLWTRALG